jgi:hypothetical protein
MKVDRFFSTQNKSILNSFNLQDQAGLLRISLEINERGTGSRNKFKKMVTSVLYFLKDSLLDIQLIAADTETIGVKYSLIFF